MPMPFNDLNEAFEQFARGLGAPNGRAVPRIVRRAFFAGALAMQVRWSDRARRDMDELVGELLDDRSGAVSPALDEWLKRRGTR